MKKNFSLSNNFLLNNVFKMYPFSLMNLFVSIFIFLLFYFSSLVVIFSSSNRYGELLKDNIGIQTILRMFGLNEVVISIFLFFFVYITVLVTFLYFRTLIKNILLFKDTNNKKGFFSQLRLYFSGIKEGFVVSFFFSLIGFTLITFVLKGFSSLLEEIVFYSFSNLFVLVFMFSLLVISIEEKSPLLSLKNSFYLIKNNTLPVFRSLFLSIICFFLFYIGLNYLLNSIVFYISPYINGYEFLFIFAFKGILLSFAFIVSTYLLVASYYKITRLMSISEL